MTLPLGQLQAGTPIVPGRLTTSPTAAIVLSEFRYAHLTGISTTTISNQPGILHTISFQAVATAVVTVYDNRTNSGSVVCVITGAATGTYLLDVFLLIGLTVQIATASADVCTAFAQYGS